MVLKEKNYFSEKKFYLKKIIFSEKKWFERKTDFVAEYTVQLILARF